jgi:hypothetical protein
MSNDNRIDETTRRFCEEVNRDQSNVLDKTLTALAAMEIKGNSDWIIDTLTPLLEQPLREIIAGLKTGSCWCQAGIDNPMMAGRHSAICLAAQKVMTP